MALTKVAIATPPIDFSSAETCKKIKMSVPSRAVGCCAALVFYSRLGRTLQPSAQYAFSMHLAFLHLCAVSMFFFLSLGYALNTQRNRKAFIPPCR